MYFTLLNLKKNASKMMSVHILLLVLQISQVKILVDLQPVFDC